MFPESLSIFLENSTIWFLISCVVSILAVVIACQYTKNVEVKNSSATQRHYLEPVAEGDESFDKIDESTSAAGDNKHEDVQMEMKNKTTSGAGGDNSESESESKAFRPDLLMAADQIPDEMMKAKERILLHQLETNMSEDQKLIEKKIQREQLSEIFKLVEEQSDKFGINSIAYMEEQMKLYRS